MWMKTVINNKNTYGLLLFWCIAALSGCRPEPASTITPSNTTAPTPTLQPTATNTLVPTPEPTPTIGAVEEFELKAKDGASLKAYLYHPQAEEEKPIAVVLAHMMNSGHWEWKHFAPLLADLGYTTLSFDFRGYGRSEGPKNVTALGIDVAAAVLYLNNLGYDRVVCIGASMGGSGCLASTKHIDLVGFVTLSGPMNVPGTSLVKQYQLEKLTIPKLFVIAEEDSVVELYYTFVTDFIHMYEIAPEPKELLLYPGDAHGTWMFDEDYGEELQAKLFEFLEFVISYEE